jgi:hypothetical protein
MDLILAKNISGHRCYISKVKFYTSPSLSVVSCHVISRRKLGQHVTRTFVRRESLRERDKKQKLSSLPQIVLLAPPVCHNINNNKMPHPVYSRSSVNV